MTRFLADESCNFSVVRALRTAGHDIKAIVEVCTGVTEAATYKVKSQSSWSSARRIASAKSETMMGLSRQP